MLTPDGKHVVFGDAFGVTRITLKTLALKHSRKLSAPRRDVTIDATGKLAVTDGHEQGGAYGNDEVVLMGVPGLGVKAKLGSPGPIAFWGDRLVHLRFGSLCVQTIDGKTRSDEREVALDVTEQRPPQTVGPTSDDHSRTTGECLSVHANGTFAVWKDRTLVVGSLHPEAAPVRYCLPLNVLDGVEVVVARDEEMTFVVVMDPAHGIARVLPVADDGSAAAIIEVNAIGTPTVAGQKLLYQPGNKVVVRRDLSTGDEERFDVTAAIEHPFEQPEDAFFAPSPRPVVTHFAGHLVDGGALLFFVPWHQETVLEVTKGVVLDRGLPPGGGPYRRGCLEILARTNERLAPLSMTLRLANFEISDKRNNCPMGLDVSWSPPDLTRAVATTFLADWTNRYALDTHGWSWGSMGRTGGVDRHELKKGGVDEVQTLLEWMQAQDVNLFDAASFFDEMYNDVLGIPSSPRPESMFLDDVAERVLVHAMLESLGGPAPVDPDRIAEWAKAPVTADEATAAIAGFQGSNNRDVHLLAGMLVHHLGAEAFAPIVSLLPLKERFYEPERGAGELLVTLAFLFPELKSRVSDVVDRVEGYMNGQLSDALGRNARHLWS